MTRTHIVETVEEFNTDGKLVCKTTRETTEENDAKDRWYPTTNPGWWTYPNPCEPTITYTTDTAGRPIPVTCVYSDASKAQQL